MFRLDGKTALVSGASKGIGEAMARGLAEFGAKVVVSSRKQDAVDAVAEELRTDGLEATAIAANMGSIDDIQSLLDKTVEVYGGLDIIVNNAAANPVFGPVQNTDERAFDKIIDVNLKGPFELCKRAHPIMQRRGGGSIINISSIGGLAMAQDWGADGIRVNAICPGLIKTKFSEALWQDQQIHDQFVNRIPLGRIGEPGDIAGLAVYLASDASAYCSGGFYMVDGGYSVN
jgi:NAD(P)-dependent dehydrogenase (short-subunit alcohol dehydrogenase family)